MICDKCGENYSDEFEFCPYCGTYPFMACPNCYSKEDDDDKICSKCGHELLPFRKVVHYYNLQQKAFKYWEKGKYEKSREIYETILHDLPNLEDIHFFLAENHQVLGDHEKGLMEYEKLAKINPDYVGVWCKIGWEYFRQGDLEKAKEYLLKEHEANPTECEHLIYLMYIYFEKGNFKKANSILDYLLSINPDEFHLKFLNNQIENNLEGDEYGQELVDINERIKEHIKNNFE